MTQPQILIFVVLLITVVLFIWGRFRHDTVALGALLACVGLGLVGADEAFTGFGHPAVITVACVLVLSATLQSTGAVDVVAHRLQPKPDNPTKTIAGMTVLAMVMSAFMNNVGAMALLMPVAIQLAGKLGISPGRVLMPVAFGAILGGMTTLIGTPPNLIVSGFRTEVESQGFGMFDFTPVGVVVALLGVAFVAVAWRLVPERERTDAESFDTGKYLTEVRVVEGKDAEGMSINELNQKLREQDGEILGVVRGNVRVTQLSGWERLKAGDQLMLLAEAESLSQLLQSVGLKLIENVRPDKENEEEEEDQKEQEVESFETHLEFRRVTARGRHNSLYAPAPKEKSEDDGKKSPESDIVLIEMVVLPNAQIINSTAADLRLRARYGINMLAISSEGTQITKRLRQIPIQAGSVLLLQGEPDALANFASEYGCVPLAERTIRVPSIKKAAIASGIMLFAIAGAALGLMPAALSFATGVLMVMVFRLIPLKRIYETIDWSVVVLLAALIPVAGAMSVTGAADMLAGFMLTLVPEHTPWIAVGAILLISMTLSDFMNNAATAAVMCPVALSTAYQLDANPDTFLMAVAIGASCAFLTPIGHQNNTLILGPGGLKFGDYWRMGLPLEILVTVVGTAMLLVVWPL